MRRQQQVMVVVVAALAGLAACADDDAATTTTPASAVTTAGSAEPAEVTTDPPVVATTGAPTSTTTTPFVEGAYASVIVDEVVDNPAFDEMERELTRRLGLVGLPGASLLVVQHGELVEQEAWLKYHLHTRVPIASASKWLTAATIMTLVDEGAIDLDAPISTYLPEAASPRVGIITMRQLLSFTSGLIADEREPCTDDGTVTLQECARRLLAHGVVHPPGEAFRYGSQHMHVAGAIAEVVTGVSFAELFAERIADPLGMTRTRFLQIGDPDIEDVTHPLPAGSAISTLGDYGRFLEMIVHDGVAPDGTRILSSASILEMRTSQIDDARYGAAASFRVATKAPYGLGEWIDWTDDDGTARVVSSDGKFGFRPWIDEVNDLFGVYLVDDRGAGYVEGDPDAAADDGGQIHTSGLWIFEWAAEALGGSLPDVQYPHRRG